jgi:hypothetical protein
MDSRHLVTPWTPPRWLRDLRLVAQRAVLDEAYMADWAHRLGIADERAFVLRESDGRP